MVVVATRCVSADAWACAQNCKNWIGVYACARLHWLRLRLLNRLRCAPAAAWRHSRHSCWGTGQRWFADIARSKLFAGVSECVCVCVCLYVKLKSWLQRLLCAHDSCMVVCDKQRFLRFAAASSFDARFEMRCVTLKLKNAKSRRLIALFGQRRRWRRRCCCNWLQLIESKAVGWLLAHVRGSWVDLCGVLLVLTYLLLFQLGN